MHRGLIGVQVHVGPPMTIEFRDIWLKHLGTAPTGRASRRDVIYRRGSLTEPEHAPTFDNLAQQAARLTASGPKAAPGGERDLAVVTRDLSVVREDLVDIKLHGGVKQRAPENPEQDLIVLSHDRTFRVPGEGHRIVGKRNDILWHVQLKWSVDKNSWTLTGLEPADVDIRERR